MQKEKEPSFFPSQQNRGKVSGEPFVFSKRELSSDQVLPVSDSVFVKTQTKTAAKEASDED